MVEEGNGLKQGDAGTQFGTKGSAVTGDIGQDTRKGYPTNNLHSGAPCWCPQAGGFSSAALQVHVGVGRVQDALLLDQYFPPVFGVFLYQGLGEHGVPVTESLDDLLVLLDGNLHPARFAE